MSGIALFLACMTYSTAFLFCGVLGCYLIYEFIKEKEDERAFIGRLLKAPCFGFLGFILVQFIIWLQTGNIGAFFLTQKKYGHGIHNPLKTLYGFIRNLPSGNLDDSIQSFISLCFLALFLVITLSFFRFKMYHKNIYTISYFSMAIMYIFLLIMGTGVTPYRQYLLCANAMMILGSKQISIPLKIFAALLFVGNILFSTKLFLDSVIV